MVIAGGIYIKWRHLWYFFSSKNKTENHMEILHEAMEFGLRGFVHEWCLLNLMMVCVVLY